MSLHSFRHLCSGDSDSLLDDSDGSQRNASLEPNSDRRLRSANSSSQGEGRSGTEANDDEEARVQMDLALNSDFDPSLFDYNWTEEPTSSTNTPSTIQMAASGDPKVDVSQSLSDGSREQSALEVDGKAAVISSAPSLSFSTRCGTSLEGVHAHGLHPLAIPSSADCPPNTTASLNARLATDAAAQASVFQQTRNSEPKAAASIANADWTTNAALLPLAYNAMAAGANLPNPLAAYLQALQLQQQLAISQQAALSAPSQQSRAKRGTNVEVSAQSSSSDPSSIPPFLLFDAPIELRANFIASQRAHGIPTMEDNNSFHYQQQASGGPCDVRLIDGRHGDVGNKRVKNAREQKRTQKITDLIDQLRDKMERGGWKVGMKSKFHTLSRYVASLCYSLTRV
jgi:hypothetical protein